MTNKRQTIHYHSGATIPSDAAKSVHVMKMCSAWAEQGHNVTLFGKTNDTTLQHSAIFDYYSVPQTFKLCLSRNVKVPILSGIIRIITNFTQTLKGDKPTLIYGRDPVSLFLQKHRRVKHVVELHQVPYVTTHHILIRYFSNFVAISDILKQDLIQSKPNVFHENNIFVAHDGASTVAPPKKANKSIALKAEGTTKNIGYAGSLHEGKGSQTLIHIANHLPDINVHIFGGTQTQIDTLKIQSEHDNVHFYGHIEHQHVASYLSLCDILIAPYRAKATIATGQDISRWISPLKLFEYMAIRKPIICSKLKVIEEILTHEEDALLIEPENIAIWCETIQSLLNTPSKQKQLSEKAYQKLIDEFTWHKRAQNILDFCIESK